MFDWILRFIWALLTVSFVGLIVYFRKPLTAIGYALSEMDLLKAGPLLYKRRKEMKKVEDEVGANIEITSKIERKSTEKEGDEQKLISNEQRNLLGMCNLILIQGEHLNVSLGSDTLKKIRKFRDSYYREFRKIDPTDKMVLLTKKIIAKELIESQQSRP